MLASNLPLRYVLDLPQQLFGLYALAAVLLAGCCHAPTITTNSTVSPMGTLSTKARRREIPARCTRSPCRGRTAATADHRWR